MESNYEKWLQQEKRWMGIYRKKVLKKTLLVTLPLTAIVLGVLFGGMTLLNGAPMQEARNPIQQRRGGAKVKTTYHYTLHCIGFYYRNRAELGTEGSELPDQAMGFFSTEIRDRAYQMIQKAFEQ